MEDVTFSEYLNFMGGKFKFSTYLGEWFGTFCWPCKGIKVKTPSEIKPPLPFENCMYALNWLSEPVLITCAEVTLFSWAWLLFSKLVAIWRESTWTLWVFLHNGGVVRSAVPILARATKYFFLLATRDIHIECSKQFKWNLYFYVSGQSGSFWAVLKLH